MSQPERGAVERPVVLCGLGRVGWRVLDSVRAAGLPVVVVDLNTAAGRPAARRRPLGEGRLPPRRGARSGRGPRRRRGRHRHQRRPGERLHRAARPQAQPDRPRRGPDVQPEPPRPARRGGQEHRRAQRLRPHRPAARPHGRDRRRTRRVQARRRPAAGLRTRRRRRLRPGGQDGSPTSPREHNLVPLAFTPATTAPPGSCSTCPPTRRCHPATGSSCAARRRTCSNLLERERGDLLPGVRWAGTAPPVAPHRPAHAARSRSVGEDRHAAPVLHHARQHAGLPVRLRDELGGRPLPDGEHRSPPAPNCTARTGRSGRRCSSAC